MRPMQNHLLSIVTEVKERTKENRNTVVAAVMGCGVNGPGEAKRTDVGVAAEDGMEFCS
jgi:(E)-4-hydroxy-3-methylbut-2-enyl-diphosphate synthase